MSDLLVIVPSRGRPHNAHALNEAWEETGATYSLVFAVDVDDPTVADYPDNSRLGPAGGEGMTAALNRVAIETVDEHFAIGFMGDDHRPKTQGWDKRIVDELHDVGTGFVYGDDLFQSANLPTAVFVTADIVRALGWMAPPNQRHLFLDNAWRDLGAAADCLRYLPDIVIEHVHPHAEKAESDDGYERVNSSEMWVHDEAAYNAWKADGFANDVARIVALCG